MLATAMVSFGQEIRDIQTTVNLFRNGNAQIIQKWDMTVTEGTEWYIPIDHPGKAYIHDLMVFEHGKKFESDGRRWDSGRSREAKAHRSGIVEKGGGDIEICWGQGDYGDHVFTVAYIIDNLVQSYPECDGFHWHFLNDEWYARPEHVSITIRNETEGTRWFHENQDSCNVRYWGFGMTGQSWMSEEGDLCFESSEPLQYESFFSALVQFDNGLFRPQVEGDGTFEELKRQAMEGSDYGDEEETLAEKIIFWIIIGVFLLIPLLLVGLVLYAIGLWVFRRLTGNRYDKTVFGKTKITGWSRDVPLKGNPIALYSLIQSGDHLSPSNGTAFSHVVSAFFLKWILEGLVRVENDPGKEDLVNLRFVKQKKAPSFDTYLENKVYQSAVSAAGDDLLEAGEFKLWSYRNDTEVTSWPAEALSWGRDHGWKDLAPEQRCQAVEFKNFLNDFTLIDERNAPEVGLWKQYMILAASLGIADKVARNFEKLFPEVMQEYARQFHLGNGKDTYAVLNILSESSSAMMHSAFDRQQRREAARAAQARRSSGGGGSISFGGGGGGYGGGHGGGSR